jgi:hypothetical protein
MQVLVSNQPSETAIRDALIHEIKTGLHQIKVNEKIEERRAAAQAAALKQVTPMKDLGKCVAVVPQDEYFRLLKKYGREELNSPEFWRFYNKAFPHLSPNKA